jgi:N-acetylmuramoyl-L-alanine amidase
MKFYKRLTVKNGWVDGFTHHPDFHGGPLPTSAVRGLISHTMEGNLSHTDDLFTPGPLGNGNSAHFGTAQDGTVIQWVPLGVVAEHAIAANGHWYAVENADDGNPNNPYTDAQLSRIAQILELTSRPENGNFTLQVTNSPEIEGLGMHNMGGAAWGGHSCPDARKHPNHTRSQARAEIVRRAKIIRQHGQYPTQSTLVFTAILEDSMLLNKGQDAITPIALPDGIKSVRFFSDQPAQLAVDTRDGKPVSKLDLNNASAHVVAVPHAIHAFVAHRLDGGSNDISVAFSV